MNQDLKTELTELVRCINFESQQREEAAEDKCDTCFAVRIMTIAMIFTASFCFVIMCCTLYLTASMMK